MNYRCCFRSVSFVIFFVLILLLPVASMAQFRGKDREVAKDVNIKLVLERQKSVVVAAKSSFGLFWNDEDGKVNFLRLGKNGKRKGNIISVADDAEYVDAVWVGDSYIVAFSRRTNNGEWLIHLAKLNEKGTKLGGYTLPQKGENTDPGGYWSSHNPALCWNGTHAGLAYSQDNFKVGGKQSGAYFHRLTKTRAKVGNRLLVNEPKYDEVIRIACSGTDFVVGLRDDKTDGGLFFQRFSQSGKKLGGIVQIKDTDQAFSHFNMCANPDGYAIVYSHTLKGVLFSLLDKSLKITKGPVTLYDKFYGVDYTAIVRHGYEYWLLWRESLWSEAPKLDYVIGGAKVSDEGKLIVMKNDVTKGPNVDDYPLGAASLGSVVVMAYVRYTPDYSTDNNGIIYTRKMKD